MSKKKDKIRTDIVCPDDVGFAGKPKFMSKESFKLISGAFYDANRFSQKTERYSVIADLFDREPPSKWASIIELAFNYHNEVLPVPPVYLKKDELLSKPISMSDKAFRELNEKHKELLDEVEETIKQNAANESARYTALAILLAAHKSRLERTLILIKASNLLSICPCRPSFPSFLRSIEREISDGEEESKPVLALSDMIDKSFCLHFKEVFEGNMELFFALKERVDSDRWQNFCRIAKFHLTANQLQIILGEKYFRDFNRYEEVEFTTKDELEAAVYAKSFPNWLVPHVQKCWQTINASKESTVIDVQLRKLRLLVNMDWGHPLPEVSRNEFVKCMNEELYGRKKLVTQLAELLSLTKNQKAVSFQTPIIMTGAFGVGKTSLARAAANASGRSFVEINCAGHSDPENLCGSSDVYVNGMHGLFFKRIAEKKSDAPVLFIDEPEKIVSRTGAGSVVNGLLSLTEEGMLEDHFVGFPIDLSRAIVIMAVNDINALPAAIRNRCHIIEVNDYSNEEKRIIAKDYIWRGLQNSLVERARCSITDEAIKLVVEHSQDETGMRKVRRILQQLVRYTVDQLEQGNKIDSVDDVAVKTVVGLPRNKYVEDIKECGCINGLAVSDHLGQVFRIESIVEENGTENHLQLFGNASDIMKESGQLALEVLRRTQGASALQAQVHLEGAGTKKDGPSAGLAMLLAMYSALRGIPIRQTVAATGEISLLGRVHPIGALPEKLRAAANAGCKQVLIPKANMTDVPSDLESIVVPVSTIDEVIAWVKEQYE